MCTKPAGAEGDVNHGFRGIDVLFVVAHEASRNFWVLRKAWILSTSETRCCRLRVSRKFNGRPLAHLRCGWSAAAWPLRLADAEIRAEGKLWR